MTDTTKRRIITILNRSATVGSRARRFKEPGFNETRFRLKISIESKKLGFEKLTKAEIAIMELLWDSEKLNARQIREQLYGDSDKAQHGTVQRLLKNLEEKGFVQRDNSLGINLFASTISREGYGGAQLENIAKQLTGGSIAPLLTHLLDEKRLNKTEIKRLRKILDEAQKRD